MQLEESKLKDLSDLEHAKYQIRGNQEATERAGIQQMNGKSKGGDYILKPSKSKVLVLS